jgi:DNA-binding CsgD family transcriptional regulator/pimeloyl-ACP methyl ester carboxylesterase
MDAPPVQYVTTSDGYDIAYAVSGAGTPLVLMPVPMNHIGVYWTEDSWYRPWLEGLASRFRLIQYDSRGQGMSGRGLPNDLVWDDFGEDLRVVVDRLELDRFVLMATGAFCHLAVRYAITHLTRVRALVCATTSVEGVGMPALYASLAEQDWNAFLHAMAGLSRAVDLEASVARLRQSTNQNDWIVLVKAMQKSNMRDDLRRLTTPTLVLHPRDFAGEIEVSMEVTSAISNARLAVIDGSNGLGDVEQGLKAINAFLDSLPPEEAGPSTAVDSMTGSLSPREVEVLRLIAAGKSNAQIADELVISQNTVIRHVSNIFAKIGAANRAEATSYAHRHGIV